ncbi:MAG: hypothetical protein RLZZ453_1316 [Chlamydiota bacterium]|jgi:UDP-3-O-[3-hydroxymyristoyl] glucosamine N-acyltransferase
MKQHTLKALADLTGSIPVGDLSYEVVGVDSLESATPADVSFLSNSRYLPLLDKTKAGVICIGSDIPAPKGKNLLICQDPSVTFQKIIHLFLGDRKKGSGFSGIHPSAQIHPTAKLGKNVEVGPYAVIDEGAHIGDNTVVSSHVYIGSQVRIGSCCFLHPHVTVREGCLIGERVILQPGAVIGSCGFGFSTNAKGEHSKLEQLGIVVIEDDVEVGANTTIDRARFKATRIGKGTKIDNLVQIGHNVEIGPHNLIVSQTGIAGSVKTGRHVVIGGQVGIAGHLEITDQVMLAAKSGVSKSITTPGKYAGVPVMPLADHNKQQVLLRKIDAFVQELKALKSQLEDQ